MAEYRGEDGRVEEMSSNLIMRLHHTSDLIFAPDYLGQVIAQPRVYGFNGNIGSQGTAADQLHPHLGECGLTDRLLSVYLQSFTKKEIYLKWLRGGNLLSVQQGH